MTERTVRLLREELAQHTYKPGHRMHVEDHGSGCLLFVLDVTTADSYHPERTVPLRFTAYVPLSLLITAGRVDQQRFGDWLGRTLREFEMHESAEWHRRAGELVNDPHAEQVFGRPS